MLHLQVLSVACNAHLQINNRLLSAFLDAKALQHPFDLQGILVVYHPILLSGDCHRHLAVLNAAMEAEAKPLLDLLGLQQDEPQKLAGPAPAQTFSGTAYGLDLHIVCNGETTGRSAFVISGFEATVFTAAGHRS